MSRRTTRRARAGVIFFNNVGYLGMCGHGTIGLVATLAHLGQDRPGHASASIRRSASSTRAACTTAQVTIENVPSYRARTSGVAVDVPGVGEVSGDIAWGGNWFFLVERPRPATSTLANVERLTDFTLAHPRRR